MAVVDAAGGYAVADSLPAARALSGKVQGRSTTVPLTHPVDVPPGEWALTLRTTWVEPAYVEPDASWCVPGGEPASPYGNGGAFGGKLHSPVAEDARRLADEHGRPVRVLWSREDVVRRGPKRPPVAAGIAADGTGVLRVGVSGPPLAGPAWDAAVAAVSAVAPGLVVEQVPVVGPPVSLDLRAAVWGEAAVLAAAVRHVAGPGPVRGHAGRGGRPGRGSGRRPDRRPTGRSTSRCRPVTCSTRSSCAPMPSARPTRRSAGSARRGSPSIAEGEVRDLTVRSFGILQARAMPPVSVRIDTVATGAPVNGSDAVFVAVAAARWLADGLPPAWPTGRGTESARR